MGFRSAWQDGPGEPGQASHRINWRGPLEELGKHLHTQILEAERNASLLQGARFPGRGGRWLAGWSGSLGRPNGRRERVPPVLVQQKLHQGCAYWLTENTGHSQERWEK